MTTKTLADFPVGARVRVCSKVPDDRDTAPGWASEMDKTLGAEGEVSSRGLISIQVDFENGDIRWSYLPHWLELVSTEVLPKAFEAGDRVRVCDTRPGPGENCKWPEWKDQYFGKIGVVSLVDEEKDLRVQFGDDRKNTAWFDPSWVTLYAEPDLAIEAATQPTTEPEEKPENWGAW